MRCPFTISVSGENTFSREQQRKQRLAGKDWFCALVRALVQDTGLLPSLQTRIIDLIAYDVSPVLAAVNCMAQPLED